MSSFFIGILSSFAINTRSDDLSSCSWTDPKWKVSFNYGALSLLSGGQLDYYSVKDSNKDAADDPTYVYHFNLCNPVLSFPGSTTDADLCKYNDDHQYSYCPSAQIHDNNCTLGTAQRPSIASMGYAYQINDDGDQCFPLSSGLSDDIAISLYDDLDPTQGLVIKYSNGAWADGGCGSNREFTVKLKCENDPSSVPRQSDVTEYAPCKYQLTIYTMHGCPSGCSAYANSLCAAQGLCGYDFSTNRSRCFCYHKFGGSSCEQVWSFLQFSDL